MQGLIRDSQLGSTLPVRLEWSGKDDVQCPILRYNLQQRRGATAPWTDIFTRSSATSTTRELTPGGSYQYRVRALDQGSLDGRDPQWSTWSTGPLFKVNLQQESNSAIVYRGAWTKQSRFDASGGAVRYSKAKGAKATLSFLGRNAAVVMPKRSTLGSARVCLDPGTSRESCSTHDLSPSTGLGPRKLVFMRNRLNPSVAHKLQVTVASGRVDLDGFVVLR